MRHFYVCYKNEAGETFKSQILDEEAAEETLAELQGQHPKVWYERV